MTEPNVVPLRSADTDEPVLHLDLDGFEGPIDVLLTLARAQKVDLRELSILDLVEQYLTFIKSASEMRLELAAEYMVMAAWLTYLKTRLLLPQEDDDEEPSAEELSLRLQLQLQRLEAMRNAGLQLVARDQLGRDVLRRGMPEGLRRVKNTSYHASLYDLLRGYADCRSRDQAGPLVVERPPVLRLEDAFVRLSGLMGNAVEWTALEQFLPEWDDDATPRSSHLASTFAASLELARQGKARLQQSTPFGALYLKANAETDA
ncbi:MAG: ScpA family protein [Pseudomonadota bacterium]